MLFVRDPSTASDPECALPAERILPQSGTPAPTKFQLLVQTYVGESSLQTSDRNSPNPPFAFSSAAASFKFPTELPYWVPNVCMFPQPKILHCMDPDESLGKTRTTSRSAQICHSDVVYIDVNLIPDFDYPRPPLPSLQTEHMVIKNGDPSTTPYEGRQRARPDPHTERACAQQAKLQPNGRLLLSKNAGHQPSVHRFLSVRLYFHVDPARSPRLSAGTPARVYSSSGPAFQLSYGSSIDRLRWKYCRLDAGVA